MTTILLLALLAVVVFYFYHKTDSGKNNIKELSNTSVDRVIRVYGMDKEQLKKAIDSFSDISENEGITSITPEGDNQFRLTFNPSLDYIGMCYWVNSLTYSDESVQRRFLVRGWYPFGEVQLNGQLQPFCNQTVMIYVDEHDNVSFVTPDGKHYLQPFSVSNNLKPLDSSNEKYIPMDEL
jgi:hypothetical protein